MHNYKKQSNWPLLIEKIASRAAASPYLFERKILYVIGWSCNPAHAEPAHGEHKELRGASPAGPFVTIASATSTMGFSRGFSGFCIKRL
jgi:hypothetical protein